MNLKFLKFLVVFMGALIVIGIIILIIGIYDKLQVSKQSNSKVDNNLIIINKPLNMKFLDHTINENKIILSYENDEKLKLIILDLFHANKIKEIDVLK